MKKQDTYRLEYNFEQKCFHHNYGQHEPESYGWITVFESITRIEDFFFHSVIDSLYGTHELTDKQLNKAKEVSIKLFTSLIDNGFDLSARISDLSDRPTEKTKYLALIHPDIEL